MDLTDIIGYIYPDATETNNFHKNGSTAKHEGVFLKKSKYELISTILVPSLYNSKKKCAAHLGSLSWLTGLPFQYGGRAQSEHVLSALVLKNEKSCGCLQETNDKTRQNLFSCNEIITSGRK